MAIRSMAGGIQRRLDILAALGAAGDLADGELLRRCLDGDEEGARAAFAVLVERHGPMVRTVCRRALDDANDADDAFQAAFLVLARKARSVRDANSLASWLHGVALRVSRRAREAALRRREHERRAAEVRATTYDLDLARDLDRPQSRAELHAEIARLPARYREPLILCHLEGLSTAAAARRLRCPQGTILSRLSRARERLRAELIRRGLAPEGVSDREGRPRGVVIPTVPAALLDATIELAIPHLMPATAATTRAASLASLARGVLGIVNRTGPSMKTLVGLAMATLAVAASGAVAYQEGERPRAASVQPAPKATAGPAAPAVVLFGPLPPRDELYRLLRQAATEAIAMTRSKPRSKPWFLTTIATAQAKSGDRDGARATFAAAVQEAAGEFGSPPSPENIGRVGEFQRQAGFKADALATFRRAVETTTGPVGNSWKDHETVRALAYVAKAQARLGAAGEARKTTQLLVSFAKTSETIPAGLARDAVAREMALALAATGDSAAAFAWSEGVQETGDILGEIARTAAICLDRESARKVVREAARRLASIRWADETARGLSHLAEAEARLGDIDAAKRAASSIGEGPVRRGYNADMTPGRVYCYLLWPWKLLLPIRDRDWTDDRLSSYFYIAAMQKGAGDRSGAGETIREALRFVREHPRRSGESFTSDLTELRIAEGDLEAAADSMVTGNQKRPLLLAYLARAQAAAGNDAAARATYARALAEAREYLKAAAGPAPQHAPGIDMRMRRSWLRQSFAEIQAMAGDLAGALETVHSFEDKDDQPSALRAVVGARATAGDVAGALRLGLAESKDREERQAMLKGLAEGVEARFSQEALRPRGE